MAVLPPPSVFSPWVCVASNVASFFFSDFINNLLSGRHLHHLIASRAYIISNRLYETRFHSFRSSYPFFIFTTLPLQRSVETSTKSQEAIDVVNCMKTDNLELKKLVYLYLMNYTKSHPDMAIMVVNTFVKDCEDTNPFIRALAVRTMGCIRVDKITEYLYELLESFLEGLYDENTPVQLQLLTAIVKLFLKSPPDTQGLVQQVLSLATQDLDNPDVRDRRFIYWRLLSTDPAAAK
ncbi:unnamed protein product [Bemisia tabaci]|uniref:Clathrin/coatomer adaptor adaptin-like N-terminal domain-containing protein n=1 Tax=Bemisia tabaci TaxID=7038 RepID=A0A9P0F022_BEMTA|nr:unnamed protein product [Bemisia tabaci]